MVINADKPAAYFPFQAVRIPFLCSVHPVYGTASSRSPHIKAFSGVGECVLLYNCCLRGEQELADPYTGCTLPVYNDGEVLCLQLPVTGCSCLLQVCYRLSTLRRKSYPQPTITSPHLSCGLLHVLYTCIVNILQLILNVLQSYPHFYALKYMLVTQEADATGLPVFPCPVMRMVWRVLCRGVDSCL